MFAIHRKHTFFKWLSISLAVFFVILIISMSLFLFFEKKYANKIYPNVFIGTVDVGGKTIEEATKELYKNVDYINHNGIIFKYHNNQSSLLPLISSMQGDYAYQLINFDIEKSVKMAFNFGRDRDFTTNLLNKIYLIRNKMELKLINTINEMEVKQFLIENFSQFETPAINAKLIYTPAKFGDGKFEIEEEKYGQVIDYDAALEKLKNQLLTLDNSSILLEAEINYPEIFKKDSLNIEAKSKKLLSKTPINLIYNDKKWIIKNTDLSQWLELKTNSTDNLDEKVKVGLNFELVSKYLEEDIATKINQKPIDAKFEIKNNKVIEFQASRDGLELDIESSLKKIEFDLINSTSSEIYLITQVQKSSLATHDINSFGINEIIGVGHSNFAGSPKNRRHNIKIGANSVNGTLIKPGEEFSLLKVLGEIDADSGYLPELVIKDNKTIPEYGGGLCQIGTTVFRGTVQSGLPVTLRRNHSYRVSYYEPAGTDATIYDPWPDYKFINDTKNYILIQSRIEGDDLYFEFWGTKDGRKIEITEPTIYNIVKPGPTKIIETLDLPVGEKKCTEHAHNGADAYFDYKVTYTNNADAKETRFKSHYIPWREVCLLGVEKLTFETEKEVLDLNTATSTTQ